MNTEIFTIDPQKPDNDLISRAADVINNGGLVAFPTETVYGIACKVDKNAIKKLDKAKNRPSDKRYTLLIRKNSELSDYVPYVPAYAKKLTEAVWPGPLTAVFDLSKATLKQQKKKLDKFAFETLYKDGSIGIRMPQGEIPALLLEKADCAIIAPSANISGQPPASTGSEVIEQLDGKVDMILDAGSCQGKQPSTVVKLAGFAPEILRVGAVSAEKIKELSEIRIVFVCTGNTCRSPMAEGICRKIMSEKLKCSLDQQSNLGYKICSAGVMAAYGLSVSSEAVRTVKKIGVDISSHISRPLTDNLVLDSDFIFVMCRSHYESVRKSWPKAIDKCFLLRQDADISDPIGAGMSAYSVCAKQIRDSIVKRIDGLLYPSG